MKDPRNGSGQISKFSVGSNSALHWCFVGRQRCLSFYVVSSLESSYFAPKQVGAELQYSSCETGVQGWTGTSKYP